MYAPELFPVLRLRLVMPGGKTRISSFRIFRGRSIIFSSGADGILVLPSSFHPLEILHLVSFLVIVIIFIFIIIINYPDNDSIVIWYLLTYPCWVFLLFLHYVFLLPDCALKSDRIIGIFSTSK